MDEYDLLNINTYFDDRGQRGLALWVYVRDLDLTGTGRVTFSKEKCMADLRINKTAFKRYLKTCTTRKFFKAVLEGEGDTLTVYYANLTKYGKQLKLDVERLGRKMLNKKSAS